MGYNPQVLLGPTGQAFVANEAPYTRRSMVLFNDDGSAVQNATVVDGCLRTGFTLPVTPTRVRFRIRNVDNLTGTLYPASGGINLTGIFIGIPSFSGPISTWAGAFTTTPTTVIASGGTLDAGGTGAEYVSAWVTNTGFITAFKTAGLSVGFNYSGAAPIFVQGGTTGIQYSATSGTAVSAAAGNTAAPGGAIVTNMLLDIRMEYEFVGTNPIGVVLGTSLESGYTIPTSRWKNCGPDETWPGKIGLRLGHAMVNNGIAGATISAFDASGTGGTIPTTDYSWTRMLDTTYSGTPTAASWPGGCTPDYAIIGTFPVNDSLISVASFTLATIIAHYANVITNLQTLGVNRIYVGTGTPMFTAYNAQTGGTVSYAQGFLATAITAASTPASVVVKGPAITGTTTPANLMQVPPGNPVALGPWGSTGAAGQLYLGDPQLGTADGPYPAAGSGHTVAPGSPQATNMALTWSGTSPTIANAHYVGEQVMMAQEFIRRSINIAIRQGLPGTVGVLDFERVAAAPGYHPLVLGDGRYYTSDNVHPATPSMYDAVADHVGPQLLGI